MVTRRKLLIAAGGAVVAVALGAIGFSMLQRPRLAVYNYSYYIDKDLLKEFEREFGVEVIYREFESGEEAYSALLRGGGGYDLVVVPDTYLKDVIAGGYVRKIDHGKLSNLGNVAPEFFENPNDRGLQYSIPYAFGITGFAVNYYAMRGVDRRLDSWSDLFDFGLLEKMRDRVAMLEEFIEPVMAAKYALGIDPDDWSDAAVNKVVDLLKRQKDYIRGYLGVSQIVDALAAGELWVSQIWSGDAATARDKFVNLAGEVNRDKFEYVLPRPKTHRWVDFMVIPRDAKNVDAAYAFIDFVLRPENAARITLASYYPTAVKKQLVAKYLPADVLEDPAVYPPEGANLIYLNYTKELLDAVERIRAAVR